MNIKTTPFIWVDLEMTGLDPNHDRIIEMATIITDQNLNTIAEGPTLIIHQTDEVLSKMDNWNVTQHTKSGLLNRVQNSKISEEQAEAETLSFLQNYASAGKSPMCGNSICQDRRFLYRHMRKLENFFHYRNLDVSSLKILAQAWAPKVYHGLKKESAHLALQDIRDSIEELKFYRQHLFKESFFEY